MKRASLKYPSGTGADEGTTADEADADVVSEPDEPVSAVDGEGEEVDAAVVEAGADAPVDKELSKDAEPSERMDISGEVG